MDIRETASEIVNNISDSVTDVSPIKEGVNDSFRVKTGGSTYFVKFGTEAGERIMSEAFAYDKISDVEEVPSPNLIDKGHVNEKPYIVTEWIEDSQVKYGVDENLSLETSRRLGIILGNMHEHVTVDNGLLGINNGIVKDWESFYREWLIHNAEDVKDKYGNLGSRIIECAYNTEIPSSNRFVLSPMDFHSGNALFREDKIVAVIDFERCYGGDPRWSFEVSKRMVESNSDDSAFCEGYKSVREIKREPVYRLAGLCREMRTAHMLYQSPEDNLSEYSKEIENIADDLF